MRLNHKNKSDGFKFGRSFAILTFLCVGVFLFLVNPAWGSGRIENISLSKEGDFTQVTILANQPFEFVHSTEEAKDGKPYRLVIDCKDMVFGLPQHDFKEGLPSGMIEAIRTSQFQVVPEMIVRVVLDLKGSVVYKVLETGSEKKGTIAILTKQDSDFSTWLAVKEEVSEEKKTSPADIEKKQISPLHPEITSQTEPKTKATEVPLPTVETSPEFTAPEKTAISSLQKGERYRKTVSYADTGETIIPEKENLALFSSTPSHDKNTKVNISKEEEVSKTTLQKSLLPEPILSPKVSSGQVIRQTETYSDQREVKKKEDNEAKGSISTSSAELVVKPTSQTKVEELLLSSKESLLKPSSPEGEVSHSSVPLGPFPEEHSYVEKTTEKAKMTETEIKTGENKKMPVDAGSTDRKGISAILGPEGASAKESDTLLESSDIIANPQDSGLALVPERKIICYSPETRRDPFLPLTDKQDMNLGVAPLPRFENLKLVGIIRDKAGNQALLEDEIGFGYILKSGDKIKNGYIMSIEDDQVVFHVEEYGGYKIMTLELNPEY